MESAKANCGLRSISARSEMSMKTLPLDLLYLIIFISSSAIFGQELCTIQGTLRLNSAVTFTQSASGRLEICYCTSGTCRWNTVNSGSISTPWSWKNVQVACRQLSRNTGSSFSGLGNPISNLQIPVANIASMSVPIYPFTFDCDGTEANLTNCITTPVSIILNIHNLDVFITCLNSIPTNSLKLTGSTVRHRGILEVYQSSTGQWQTVCADNFDSSDANVICKTIGYAGGDTAPVLFQTTFRGSEVDTSPGILSIQCSGSENDIADCNSITRGNICDSNRLAAVQCTPSTSSEGTARLFMFASSSVYQRVEILYSGRWGTVCNTNWNVNDGQVVCRSLGLGVNDVHIPTSFSSGPSQRTIWAAGYNCRGTESRLQSCAISYPFGYTPSCTHINDAVLSCTGNDNSSGLSGGGIAGIVLSILIFVFIILPFVYIYGKSAWKRGTLRGWWNRTICAVQQEEQDNITPTRQQRRQSLSSDTSTRSPTLPENAEFTEAPPPSYDDALHLQQVTLPEYTEQQETITNALPPYPESFSDPAYPPSTLPPFQEHNYQEYSPPTK